MHGCCEVQEGWFLYSLGQCRESKSGGCFEATRPQRGVHLFQPLLMPISARRCGYVDHARRVFPAIDVASTPAKMVADPSARKNQ
jgi:hypothetical protein